MSGDKQQSNRELIMLWGGAILASIVFLIALFLIANGGQTRVEMVKALGGFGTFAAAGAVVWGFRYTRDSIDTQYERNQLEHQSRLNDHYFRTCGELGSDNEHVRIAAIYALKSLAENHLEFYEQTIHVIAGFIRHRSVGLRYDWDEELSLKDYRAPEDLQSAFSALGHLSQKHSAVWGQITGNLDGAAICGINLNGISFVGWSIRGAVISNGFTINCDFRMAFLEGTLIVSQLISDSMFQHAWFMEAHVHNVTFRGCDFRQSTLKDSSWRDVTFDYFQMPHCKPFEHCHFMPPEIEHAAYDIENKFESAKPVVVTTPFF